MLTEALKLAETTTKAGKGERLTWGAVEFLVTDINRSTEFWTTALGLRIRKQSGVRVELGTEGRTLLVLHAGAAVAANPRQLGMYHVAIGVPTQAEFSRLLARLLSLKLPISPTDHLMSKAIYLSDPDGLGIEIAFETPERFGRFGDFNRGIAMYDVDGNFHNGRERLDLHNELAFDLGEDLSAPIANDATLAHLHLQVPALASSIDWFEQIGFARNLVLPQMGFGDMGAGAKYSHRLAMNTWAGTNIEPAPKNMARLLRYELQVNDPSIIAGLKDFKPSATGFKGTDPAGVEISLVSQF